jgi:hypothetical protein
MRPKLTANCSSMLMPTTLMRGALIPRSALMMLRSTVEAKAVALAKPRAGHITRQDV